MSEPTIEQDALVKKQIQEKRENQASIEDRSLIIVHTGDGKGKTTAALGLIVRTLFHGWNVAMVQFMKDPDAFHYGETKLAQQFPAFEIYTMGAGFTWDTQNRDLDIKTTLDTWEKSKEIILSNKYKLVVLDEINYVIDYGFLPLQDVLDFLKQKPKDMHIVLTGRNAAPQLIELADLVTEMKNIKHPYEHKGILAQKGIEW